MTTRKLSLRRAQGGNGYVHGTPPVRWRSREGQSSLLRRRVAVPSQAHAKALRRSMGEPRLWRSRRDLQQSAKSGELRTTATLASLGEGEAAATLQFHRTGPLR